MPIQIIWGNDNNACDKEIEKIINTNISKQWESFNLSKFNGDDSNQVLKALEETQTPPFGEGSRVIILKNNPLFNTKNEILATKFQSTTHNIPNSSYLILHNTQKPDSRIKTTKSLKKLIDNGEVIESFFKLPERWDINSQIEYIENLAKDLNIKLERKATLAILESIGTESSKLNNELEKALLYLSAKNGSAESEILLKESDIKEIFHEKQSNIFQIIDSLLESNIYQSLIDINNLINQGEPPLRLLSGLTSQIRIHTIVLLLEKETDLSKISKLAGIANPKRIFFIKKKVKNCNPEFLINLMIHLLTIETDLKKGNNPINVFTENLASLTY